MRWTKDEQQSEQLAYMKGKERIWRRWNTAVNRSRQIQDVVFRVKVEYKVVLGKPSTLCLSSTSKR